MKPGHRLLAVTVSVLQEGAHFNWPLCGDQQCLVQLGLLSNIDRIHGQDLHGELRVGLALYGVSVLYTTSGVRHYTNRLQRRHIVKR